MKIAIITQPLWFNYGGILQNYALQKSLENMGHEVYTIDLQPDLSYKINPKHIASFLIRLVKRFVFRNKNVKISWNPDVTNSTIKIISKNTSLFIKNNIKTTPEIDVSKIRKIAEQYSFDAYVVGSDQVWIPSYYPIAFIPFDNRSGVKKVFYAASAGNTSWMDDVSIRDSAFGLIKEFDGISVREESLRVKFTQYSEIPITRVLDPTLLLEKEKYIQFVKEEKNSRYLFTYILDQSSAKNSIIEKVGVETGLNVIAGTPSVPYQAIRRDNKESTVYASVEDWLTHYYYADFIVTDSFHGTVFSILFNKQFVVIVNKERGLDRFSSLLDEFNLSDRIVTDVESISDVLRNQINYNEVNNKIITRRAESIQFIKDSLSNKL